jgi:hypothetical protein
MTEQIYRARTLKRDRREEQSAREFFETMAGMRAGA